MKKTTPIFPIMALSTLLVACGSGGKGSSEQSPASLNTTNKTAPAVAQKTPVEKPAKAEKKQQAEKQSVVAQPAKPSASAAVATPVAQAKPLIIATPAEQPKVEQPKAEHPQAEQPKLEQPQAEQPKVEQPKVEQPKVEQPQVEQPQAEQPQVEQPKAEQPKAEQPKAEQPKAEQPKAEQPKVEQPKVEQPNVEPPKVEESQVEEQKANEPVPQPEPQPEPEKIVWSDVSNFPHSKDQVPVIYLIENDKADAAEDPNIKEKQNGVIALQAGKNQDAKNHYLFYASDNAYYGFYRDSEDMMSVKNNYVYSFDEKAENKADLSGLNATYNGKFIYSTRSVPQLAMPAKLALRYTDGKAEGEIISHLYDDKLFDVKSTDNTRTLELNPTRQLDNSWEDITVKPDSPDRAFIDVHFINGNDGKENKTLVGKGGNEKYWGVLGADKTE